MCQKNMRSEFFSAVFPEGSNAIPPPVSNVSRKYTGIASLSTGGYSPPRYDFICFSCVSSSSGLRGRSLRLLDKFCGCNEYTKVSSLKSDSPVLRRSSGCRRSMLPSHARIAAWSASEYRVDEMAATPMMTRTTLKRGLVAE